jgi:hypothetical protein
MSYSHKDDRLRGQLAEHLASMRREGLVDDWHDRKLVPGEEWDAHLMDELGSAQLIVLLVSSAFMASEFCWSRELAVAMARHEAGSARVVPVIVRPTEWERAPFGKLQALPRDGKAVTRWSNRDEAWVDVAQGLRRAIADAPGNGRAPPVAVAVPPPASEPSLPARSKGEPRRLVYDAQCGTNLPGVLVRSEGGPPCADPAVESVYYWLGQAHSFLYEAFGHDSLDGRGGELIAVVHYGRAYGNAFWDGRHVVLGDGGDRVIRSLAATPDATYKEVMNGFVQHAASFDYAGQSGSLRDAAAIVFALLTRQFVLRQPVEAADWRFGAGVLGPDAGTDLIADPSKAASWKDFQKTSEDGGGVHVNSPIAQHAFYRLAVALGGRAWEGAGQVWYDALTDADLEPDSTFRQFARVTVAAARRRFGDHSEEATATRQSWIDLGVKL